MQATLRIRIYIQPHQPTSNLSLGFAHLFQQLHSEYRSTYRWHEFTGNSRPEVVRRAPAPNPSQFVGMYPLKLDFYICKIPNLLPSFLALSSRLIDCHILFISISISLSNSQVQQMSRHCHGGKNARN